MKHKDLKWFVKLTYFYHKIDKTFVVRFWDDLTLSLDKKRSFNSNEEANNYILEYRSRYNYILEYRSRLAVNRTYYLAGYSFKNYDGVNSILETGLLNYYEEFISEFNY